MIAESLRHISRKHDDYKIVEDCEELVLVRMDVQLIIQVLVNLIDNAIKYTPPGSVICIRGIRTGRKAQISVEDNGPGIPEEMKPHIFEMFYTGKTTVADSQRSLGLGLALCRSIIEAHDGTLIITTLKTHDYKYLSAENGSSAILEASSHNPDIALLDLGLPDIEGVEVIKKIRTWSNMPIIVISARSEDTDKIEALDAGADAAGNLCF